MSHLAFAAWFTGTVLVTRLALWIRPTPSPTVSGVRLHHRMFGAVLAYAGWITYWDRPLSDVPFLAALASAVGCGLFVDEATYLLLDGKTHADNYSRWSLIGTAALVAAVDLMLWGAAP